MKKLAYFILGSLIVLAPFTASALEAMNVESMKAATGQAGVTIGIDDVILYQDTGATTYTDIDGTDGTAGSIKITGAESLLFIDAIVNGDNTDVFDASGTPINPTSNNYVSMITAAAAGTALPAGTVWGGPSALTIDVGVCALLTSIADIAAAPDKIGGVTIGLPTLEIYDALANNTKTITFEGAAGTYANAGDQYIQITTEGSTMALLSPTAVIEIAPH